MSDSLPHGASPDPIDADKKRDAPELQDSDLQSASVELEQNSSTGPSFHLPGPGLPEAIVWTIGIFPAQIVSAIIASGMVVVLFLLQGGTIRSTNELSKYLEQQMVIITGGGLFLFVLIVMIAAFLRLGGFKAYRRLSLVSIPRGHFLLIILIVLPLSMLTGQLHMIVDHVWQIILDQLPFLGILDQMKQQEMLKPLVEGASLPTLLLIIAVSPAIGEELVFRGVIGRGLLARLGPVTGVLITSVLFALLHLHPAVVVALMPLAILLHLLYLATRSFLAPVLLHFLNNAWAAVVMKYSDMFQVEGLADEQPIPVFLLLSAIVCVVPICLLVWRTRARYYLPDGTEWSPGYVTTEQPPANLQATRMCDRAPSRLTMLTVFAIVQFAAVFVIMALQSMPAE